MRNGLARFKEEFPSDAIKISLALGAAIRSDNQNALNQLITTHFSRPETRGFLDGTIAVYMDDDEEVHIHTPAILALRSGSRNTLRTILRATRNPNAREDPDAPENSHTLLMLAVLEGDIDTVKLLLEEGVDVNEEYVEANDDGERTNSYSALLWAVHFELIKITNLLLDNGAVPTFMVAFNVIRLSNGLDPLLVKLIELRPELLNEQSDERTGNLSLLGYAAFKNNLPTVKWLVEQGSNVNSKSLERSTPLDLAVSEGNKEVSDFLQCVGGITGKASEAQISDSTKQEITKSIERLELLEEKFGIAISGLYATCRYESYGSPPYHEIEINFDLSSLSDGKLERSFNVIASAYNSAGQLLKTDSTRIYADDFMGFSPVSITLHLDQSPEKIRLFPAA